MIALRRSFFVGGIDFPIRTDFREIIELEKKLHNPDMDEARRIMDAVNFFYKTSPPVDVQRAMDQMLDFYRCEQAPRPPISEKSKGRAFSYEQDAPLFYSAYLSQYGVDLCDIEYLHWYKFRAMFEGLSPETQLMRVIGYRTADLSKMGPEMQKSYRELRRHYALDIAEADRERMNAVEQALLSGKGIEGLL